MRHRLHMLALIGGIATLALSGCSGSPKESYVAPASTLTEAPPFMEEVVEELVSYIPPEHIEESWYHPEKDQTRSTMFCSADLDGVSDYIRITRGGLMWADDTVDVVEVAKQIEADYSAKPGWIVTRPEEGYSGPEITVRSPEHYIFNVNIDAETGYFAIGAWSPCFPKPPEHRTIHKY
ncbi:hypothetical protein FB468_1283 [Leucobacter komagatae]|uniref:Lipoprotein n=2 Tax=Leucobacter komagatae TaxID=55969 RepID=A0A542Y5E2_9MICO|nr:hypothetical protein FB468_1283 [Leucobacter komagatae]